MSNEKTGGQAFPMSCTTEGHAPNVDPGMTLRDYFAAKVAAGDAAFESGWSIEVPDEAITRRAKLYYRIADAMLKAREA
jgi:hypothetical protein